jgi:hypothetical protein
MKQPSPYTLDYAESLLSAFDISGSLILKGTSSQPKNMEHDMNQLMKDLDKLEADYRNACQNIVNDHAL